MFRIFDKISRNEVYVIAEMSANHGGSLENALRIVHEAAKAGADCVKIQTYTADSITIDCRNEYFQIHDGGLWDGYVLHDLYKYAGTPYEWQGIIKTECEKCGVDFLSTPFDPSAVDFLEGLGIEAYKIASYELNDIPLIEYAASKGKPMIMSCGMASPEEIQDAVDACRNAGNNQIVLLKCCTEYPANWEDMHLGNIPDMRKRFGLHVGLSDHSFGSLGAVVAVALGARVIEKHIMIDGVTSADTGFSMNTEDFAKMVDDARNAVRISQGPDYSLSPKEKSSMIFRRSLFAVKDIKAGDEISAENVRSIRPANGINPKFLRSMLGRKAKSSLEYGQPVTQEFYDELMR